MQLFIWIGCRCVQRPTIISAVHGLVHYSRPISVMGPQRWEKDVD